MRLGGQDGECLGHRAFATKMPSPAAIGPWCLRLGHHHSSPPSAGHVGRCSCKCQFINLHQISLKKTLLSAADYLKDQFGSG